MRAFLAGILLASVAAAGNPKVELGRRLFMDPTVSRGARFSCASCHDPEHGFSDARVLSVDENGKTARHSQPLLGLKDGVGMHWDGEFFRVRELLVARLASTTEARDQARTLAHRRFTASGRDGDRGAFEERLRATAPPYYEGADASLTWAAPLARRLEDEGRYAALFTQVYGTPDVTTERLIGAVEAYVLSLRPGTSPYDRFARGDALALSASAQRGLELFRGKAGCVECHSGTRFTDDKFHDTGVAFAAYGNPADTGFGSRTFLARDNSSFKTPSLRDVARRAPYMHDGTLRSLRDVVLYYDRGGTKNQRLDPRVHELGLEPQEVDDLVAFLESLTSDERPGLGSAGARATARVRIEDLEGNPIEGLAVRVEPFGDRLKREGAPGAENALDCTTDRNGAITFRYPDWTHVTLKARGFSIGEGQPLPDCVRETRLIAAPVGKTAVRLTSSQLPLTFVAQGASVGDITFRRVRGLDSGEALYAADREVTESAVVTIRVGEGFAPGRHVVEFGAGFTQAIDLRPPPERPPASGPISPVPTKASENGGRESEGNDRAASRRGR